MYKVFIPSAGLGTRLGDFSKNLNKALVAVDNRPVISHVIEKFPKHIEIVVALGHKSDTLKQYLSIAHSDRNITFVQISNYCQPGSGLGLTILECKEHLQCPFIFCPNDTIVEEDIPEPTSNWVGYSRTKEGSHYRTLSLNNTGQVCGINEKTNTLDRKVPAYIGLAGISDFGLFWNTMESGRAYGSIKIGESYGITKMIEQSVKFDSIDFTWYDVGNLSSLRLARQHKTKKDSPEILEKQGEAIWFVNDRVIKYSEDTNFIKNRIERSEKLKGFVPEIIHRTENMYAYREITGQVLSKLSNHTVFDSFVKYLKSFWDLGNLLVDDSIFQQTCNKFYKDKTLKRVALYFDRFSEKDTEEIVNGTTTPPLYDLLGKVDWNHLSEGMPVRFHGDLHFENVLLSETGDFYLLDWRQDFGGNTEYGDLYYDLAKLLHGLIVSHGIINKDLFYIEKVDNIIKYDFHRKNMLVQNEHQFFQFLKKEGFDVDKVKLLTALIFLNIAPLHHYPYSKLLFYLGKSMLYKQVTES